jgi:hypothetical protein
MIKKVLIPLEDVAFRGADDKIRLRYRLKSKDGNETSQWSPVYTVNPTEIRDVDATLGDNVNPIEYSGWAPTSSSDNEAITINTDSGWINDKLKIPCKTFDVFISYNYGTSAVQQWGYQISKYGIIANAVNDTSSLYSTDGTATITDLDSTEFLSVGDYLLASPEPLGSPVGILIPTSASARVEITKIVNPSTIEVKSVTLDGGVTNHSMTNGVIKNVIKYGLSAAPVFKYEGTTSSGQFLIDIPKKVNLVDNVIAYQYQLTPGTKPPTLNATNFLYASASISSNSSTIQFNTIDGGSPS